MCRHKKLIDCTTQYGSELVTCTMLRATSFKTIFCSWILIKFIVEQYDHVYLWGFVLLIHAPVILYEKSTVNIQMIFSLWLLTYMIRSLEGYWRLLTRSSSTGLPMPFFVTIYGSQQNAACLSDKVCYPYRLFH